jgi:hypothetical protein
MTFPVKLWSRALSLYPFPASRESDVLFKPHRASILPSSGIPFCNLDEKFSFRRQVKRAIETASQHNNSGMAGHAAVQYYNFPLSKMLTRVSIFANIFQHELHHRILSFAYQIRNRILAWRHIGRLCTHCVAFDGVWTKSAHAAFTGCGRRSF